MLRVNEVEVKGINTHTKVDDENNETTKTLVDLVLPEGHPFALKTETNNDGDSEDYVLKSDLGEEVNDQLEHSLDYYVRKENLESEVNDILEHGDVLNSEDLKGYVYEDDIEEHVNQYIDSANVITEDNADEYLDLIDRDTVQRIVEEEVIGIVERTALKKGYRPDDPDADGSSDSDSESTVTANTAAAPEVEALQSRIENLEDELFSVNRTYERLRVTMIEMYKSIRPAIDHYNYFQPQISANKDVNVFELFEPDFGEDHTIRFMSRPERLQRMEQENESKRSDTAA